MRSALSDWLERIAAALSARRRPRQESPERGAPHPAGKNDMSQHSGSDDKANFLYPHHRYHGEVKPENLAFNANLQEFAQKVSYICNLETNGQIASSEAYEQIKALWGQLQRSKEQLQVGEDPFRPPE